MTTRTLTPDPNPNPNHVHNELNNQQPLFGGNMALSRRKMEIQHTLRKEPEPDFMFNSPCSTGRI